MPSYVFHQEARLRKFNIGESDLTESELEELNLTIEELNHEYRES